MYVAGMGDILGAAVSFQAKECRKSMLENEVFAMPVRT